MSSLGIFLVLFIMTSSVWAGEKEYKITLGEWNKHKALFDDPRPLFKALGYKKVLPTEVYDKLTFDEEAMKRLWAEVVGFKAPDVVGKVAPEIKPGIYTYKDKGKYPGLKKLMYPDLYKRFNPGGPPHVGNIPEIKVVPTRQYYWALPIAEATKKHIGATQLDSQGYIKNDTYVAGFPFPMPSGNFKAKQIMYNWDKRYYHGENYYVIQQTKGYTKDLKEDFDGLSTWHSLRLHGRVLLEPYGWYDKRAEKMGEARSLVICHQAPRDLYGTAFSILTYLGRDDLDRTLIYIPVLRRIRKMSASDTQDAVGGQDIIYEDAEGFNRKLNPDRYPYKFEVIDEREYLIPAPSWDGSGYFSSKDFAFHNREFERRPTYVVKLTQLDKNYVYGHSILYIDKETFLLYHIENYDQKGRLYRTCDAMQAFIPQMGMFMTFDLLFRDHIDLHSVYSRLFVLPAPWVERKHVGMRSLVVKGK